MKDLITLKNMMSQLMAILDKKQKKKIVGMIVIIFLGASLEMLGVSMILPFIQAILTPEIIMNKPYVETALGMLGIHTQQSVLTLAGISIILVYFVKNIYLGFVTYMKNAFSNNTRRQLSTLMLKSYMSRPYSFFVDNGSGVILRGVGDDTEGVYTVIQNLLNIFTEGFCIILIAIYLVYTDYFLTIGICFVGILCMATIVFGVKRILSKLAVMDREASMKLGKSIVQINEGIKEIMVYNRQDVFAAAYDNAYEKYNIANTKSTFFYALPERIIEGFCIAGIITTVLIRVNMGINAEEFVPQMGVFAMGAFRMMPSISRLTGYISMLIYARPKLESMYENIVSAREYNKSIHVNELEESNTTLENEISVRSLDWRYPKGEKQILDNFELHIKKGEAIGIIGESGAGKSTLADLLLQLYRPQKGGIFMDGVDIATIPRTWSKVIAYVPQTVFLIDDTVRANVVFGATEYSDEDVWSALNKASIEEFVKGLPDKLDTVVGERGVKLSGGQRQRIAIARALLVNPQIMILDEATAALDNETEAAVMEAVDSLMGAMTLIIIAHRLSTLKNCDKIYEISDGKAVERKKDEIIK